MTIQLTPAQDRVLAFLRDHPRSSAAIVGWAISNPNRPRPLTAQAAGRLAGRILWQLQALALAYQPRNRIWSLTTQGRAHLQKANL